MIELFLLPLRLLAILWAFLRDVPEDIALWVALWRKRRKPR